MSRLVMFAYDPEWPRLFEEETRHLREVWKKHLIAVHHIGSTSVPGLTAKPIIDIMVVVSEAKVIPAYDPAMIALGYRPRGECLEFFGTPGRYYYSKDIGGLRTHQTHVMQEGHQDIEQKLNFRDYLRAHPVAAGEYAELKTRLIVKNTKGISEYIEGKDSFVKQHIEKAALWKTTM